MITNQPPEAGVFDGLARQMHRGIRGDMQNILTSASPITVTGR
jgi:hypothetical protein